MNKGPVLIHNAKEDSKYSHNKEPLTLLEERGVFNPPCNLGITVEDLNSLFFLKKPNGEFHLVTAFAHPAEPPLLSSFLNSCTRYFFAFDVDKTIKIVYDNCFNFAPLRNTPHTSDNRRRQKVAIGVSCAADAMHKKGNTFNST